MNASPAASPPRAVLDPERRAVVELLAALNREAMLAGELAEVLVTQRETVAAGDPGAIDASVDHVRTVLLTLHEARERRRLVVEGIGADPGAPLETLEHLLPGAAAELAVCRAALARAASQAAREASINRGVIRRLIDSGGAFLQALFSYPEAPGYGPDERHETAPPAGVIVNRRA